MCFIILPNLNEANIQLAQNQKNLKKNLVMKSSNIYLYIKHKYFCSIDKVNNTIYYFCYNESLLLEEKSKICDSF
jgi:hypothetical protein